MSRKKTNTFIMPALMAIAAVLLVCPAPAHACMSDPLIEVALILSGPVIQIGLAFSIVASGLGWVCTREPILRRSLACLFFFALGLLVLGLACAASGVSAETNGCLRFASGTKRLIEDHSHAAE